MIKIEGQGGITATIIQDSTANGIRITTFELEYPRFIHSELMTHRMFSRNAASSRAIPIEAVLERVQRNPATPIHWGVNQPGMQAKTELTGEELLVAQVGWSEAASSAIDHSGYLAELGVHKQIANRITEPFQFMTTVVTATEWQNWYDLRNHEDAQPEIHELARCMLTAHLQSTPMQLNTGDWHVPYVERTATEGQVWYYSGETIIDKPTAVMISASCCAQVSYRKNDDSVEKARAIYDRLVGMTPKHSSPFEHQARVPAFTKNSWEIGYTHMDRKQQMWSGNFRGWTQNRQLI